MFYMVWNVIDIIDRTLFQDVNVYYLYLTDSAILLVSHLLVLSFGSIHLYVSRSTNLFFLVSLFLVLLLSYNQCLCVSLYNYGVQLTNSTNYRITLIDEIHITRNFYISGHILLGWMILSIGNSTNLSLLSFCTRLMLHTLH